MGKDRQCPLAAQRDDGLRAKTFVDRASDGVCFVQRIDLATGKATAAGKIDGLAAGAKDIAILPKM